MEHFFHRYFRRLHHHIHTIRKTISHHKLLQTKNARLALILIIAAAIPLTVMGVQQIQDIRQSAKEPNECGPESYPLRVSKNPAADDEIIIFSHADGQPITQYQFEEEEFTGNGAVGCELKNGTIECKARYTSKSKKPQSDHTYQVTGNKCNYSVLAPIKKPKDPNKPTKDPNKPTPTKTPRKPDEPPTSGKCEANLSANNCSGDNKPRLRASWDMTDEDKGCSIKIGGVEVSTECTSGNKDITDLNGKALESGKEYEIVISNNGSCKGAEPASAEAPKCAEKATPTPKGGKDPTPTKVPFNPPKPGTPTPTRDPSVPGGEQLNPSPCAGGVCF